MSDAELEKLRAGVEDVMGTAQSRADYLRSVGEDEMASEEEEYATTLRKLLEGEQIVGARNVFDTKDEVRHIQVNPKDAITGKR